jgi:hypothetical protein
VLARHATSDYDLSYGSSCSLSAGGGASGESLSRRWCRGQQWRRFRMLWTSMEALVKSLPAWSLFFQVKTFLQKYLTKISKATTSKTLLGKHKVSL